MGSWSKAHAAFAPRSPCAIASSRAFASAFSRSSKHPPLNLFRSPSTVLLICTAHFRLFVDQLTPGTVLFGPVASFGSVFSLAFSLDLVAIVSCIFERLRFCLLFSSTFLPVARERKRTMRAFSNFHLPRPMPRMPVNPLINRTVFGCHGDFNSAQWSGHFHLRRCSHQKSDELILDPGKLNTSMVTPPRPPGNLASWILDPWILGSWIQDGSKISDPRPPWHLGSWILDPWISLK